MKLYSFLSESITNHFLKFAIKNSTSKKTREKIKDKYQQYKDKRNADKESDNDEEFRPVDLSIEDQQDEEENPFED